MGILDFMNRNKEVRLSEIELSIETTNRVYLKRLALDTCINFIGRTISDSEFRVMKENKAQSNTLFYKLNVRPNTDKSAANFWQDFVYKLIYENEVLVIKTDTDDLVIADYFVRKEMALYDDTFEGVLVDMRGKLAESTRWAAPHYQTPIAQLERGIHHSATLSTLAGSTTEAFARFHVHTHDWPCIGYKFSIEPHNIIETPDGPRAVIHYNHSLPIVGYHVGCVLHF
ncbi:phage portal protein [Salinicoccus halodurans]|uniref:Phage portal protein, HK97 family n=1 Tax=Salinicoccus halodurans TaxID=407035 RepID=A0A0F7D4K9_9STAP|nr:phage portal protein [Salinicoccus halodurans]AKG74415.1 hypothetical protein AAT16_09395 [Salinicoccus halodurans]SFK95745.1 phage portal protein, HK97 family [Salinicoccus halodurans]